MTTLTRSVPDLLVEDLPGELPDPDGWEEVIETECAVCWEVCTPIAPVGLCWRCHARYKATDAGCGLAAILVVTGNPATALAHLTKCFDCRDVFLDLGETARVADMETRAQQNAHAAQLGGITA